MIKKYVGVFVFGDFNLNLLKCNDNNLSEYVNLMYSFSLFQLINKPTRVTNTSATIIDHTWSTLFEENISNNVILTDISDHFPTVSQFRLHCAESKPQFIYKRSFSTVTIESFVNNLSLINWQPVLSSSCCNNAYDIFYEQFKNVYDRIFPLNKIRLNNKNQLSPYITPALKRSIREKHRLERLSKKWPLTYGNTYKTY